MHQLHLLLYCRRHRDNNRRMREYVESAKEVAAAVVALLGSPYFYNTVIIVK